MYDEKPATIMPNQAWKGHPIVSLRSEVALGCTKLELLPCVLQTLLDAKVVSAKDALLTISTEATQEAALEDLLAKVVAKWAGIDLSVVPYKDSKDVYILGSIDNIQVGSCCG